MGDILIRGVKMAKSKPILFFLLPNGAVFCDGVCLAHRFTFEETIEAIEKQSRWIPVSEGLPKDRNWYLGTFKEPDTGWIIPIPFVCDYVGKETKATTKEFWILRGITDIDNPCDYYKNLECVAWQSLPELYKAESEDK